MPRVARLDTPGLLHHVMIRGIERRRIFNDNENREKMSMVDMAMRLDITPAAVSYAVQRGEKMTKEDDYQLELLKL
jgi:hypothetical protein